MNDMLEKIAARLWNRDITPGRRSRSDRGLDFGSRVLDEQRTSHRVEVPHSRRAEHIAILGKTGGGKSSLLRYLCRQDIEAGRGFIYFDLHGDGVPFLLTAIAEQERKLKRDLSCKTIVVEPADADFSVGLNPLEQRTGNSRFVQISEFAQVLRQRWHLDTFGARTDELLRNSLHVLADSGLTLLELSPLLSNTPFRTQCLKETNNPEVRLYFQERYDRASEPMRAVMREPILNKVSAFTGDLHFRHIVGQRSSTFSFLNSMDEGCWVLLNLHKGKLGEQAITLGSLLLTTIKNTLFSRQNRQLYTLFCDELQNLIAFDSGIETILSEARKFAVSVVSANQFLDQYPAGMRAAVLAVGTHIFFQLSSGDAQAIAAALDGGKALAELLKHLPRRNLVLKTGHERWVQSEVPHVAQPEAAYADLYERCRQRWARRRTEIEAEIAQRQRSISSNSEVLDAWE